MRHSGDPTWRDRLGTPVLMAWRARPATLTCYVLVHLALGVVPVAVVGLTGSVVDRLADGGLGAMRWLLGGGLVAALFGAVSLPPLLRFLQSEISRSVSVTAKRDLYEAVGRLPLITTLERPEFRDRLRLAEEASRNSPNQVVSSGLGAVQSGVTLVGLVGAVALIAPHVAVLLVVAGVPALAAQVHVSRRRAAMLWSISPQERREFFYSELLTNLSAAKETRLYGSGPLLRRRMLDELTSANRQRRAVDVRELWVQGALSAAAAGAAGLGLLWAVVAADAGRLSVGDLAALVIAMTTVQATLSTVVEQLVAAHQAGLLMQHVTHVKQVSAGQDPAGRDPTTVGQGPPQAQGARLVPDGPDRGSRAAARGEAGVLGAIEVDDVWFRYSAEQPWVIRGLSTVIGHGEALGVVGVNGSGKSTLVKLLCRLYDPTRGSIRWGGVDLRDIDPTVLRRRMSAVFQDFMCYDLTANENIALGDLDGRPALDLADERIARAAGQVDVLRTLDDLPRGRDTLLSRTFVDRSTARENGVLLSGGQWQRVALARALVRGRRELLVLDEPSSGLDAEAEYEIHRTLASHRRGLTSILVSHRLNTIRDADRIVVLAQGRIVEEGSHRDLLRAGGEYARLFALQSAGFAASPAGEGSVAATATPARAVP